MAATPVDLFEVGDNWVAKNLTAGRSVTCVDRLGDGRYGIMFQTMGAAGSTNWPTGPPNQKSSIVQSWLDQPTGGRAVVSGHIQGHATIYSLPTNVGRISIRILTEFPRSGDRAWC